MDENFEDNNAKENFEDNNANENLLSQSYLDSIQKVTGNNRASLLDFQIPDHLLEKRKNDWNALFEKYSSFVCEEQDEPEEEETKQYESEQDEPEQEEPEQEESEQEESEQDEPKQDEPEHEKEECTTKNNRFPMRKPMSMVQYWVDTGNQPYAKNNLEKSQSESGSSLAEECLEEVENMNSPCQMINTSIEKNHETNETSRNMHLRLANSSGSSVDTVAYILANNNTTKKADTIAIMEGSKIVNKELSHHSVAINDKEKVNKSKKDFSFLDNMLFNLRPTELDVNIAKNINKNLENINNVNKNLQNKSQNPENCSNDSDESIFKSKYHFHILSQNSIDQNNDIEKELPATIIENKTFKRKKLYNNTESPAEFTPVSEDNASQLTLRLPIKKCEHPALETPRISSRPSYLVRYQRLKLRTKRKSRISHSFKMLQSQKNGENNHLQNLLQGDPQTINEVEKINDQNLENTVDCSNDIWIQERCKRKSDSLNKNLLKDFEQTALNLKPLVIPLQRLPYKYESIKESSIQEKQLDSLNLNKNNEKIISTKNNSQYSRSKKSRVLEAKSDNYKNLINGVSPNSTSNDESGKIDFKSSLTESHGFSSQIQNSYSKKSMNYIITFSSDDEPELSVSNLKQSTQKLLKETSQIKNSSNVNDYSEKELIDSNSKDDDVDNKISISESNKIKSERKKYDLKRKSDNLTKLVQSEKNRMPDASCKSLILKSNNKSSSKCFAFSKQMDKKLSLMSSDEETIIFDPKDCSVPNKFLEKSKANLSPGNKALKEKFDQTSSNTLSSNKKQKSSSNEKKSKVLESKSVPLKKSTVVKNLRYSRNTSSSSEEDLQLPVKSNLNCKPKVISSAVKDNSAKSSPATEETVTNLIDDLSVNSVFLRKNEKKLSLLEERINKMKMKTQSTLLNSDNNHLKNLTTQTCLQIDSSEEENIIENKSSVKEIVKKKTYRLNKNKRSFEDHSEVSNDKSRNKKDREKSKKEYLSSKKPKRKSEKFMSSDEECVIPLKIKST